MGRTTLEYLKRELKLDLSAEVLCYSSRERDIQLSDGEIVRSRSLKEISRIRQRVHGVFHFAFLTRDFVSTYGVDKYVAVNLSILDFVSTALQRMSYSWIVGVSSGAVFDPGTHNQATDINRNPYGYLKLLEEKLLQEVTTSRSANCVIGRLWGSSGYLMPVDRKYAISDFIYQGLTSDQIQINSSYKVWRRYMDAQDFIAVLHKMADSGMNRVLDSAGDLVEVGQLATKIALITNSDVVRQDDGDISNPDLYFPSGDEMRAVVQGFGLALKGIDEQLISTISGHSQQLTVKKG